MESVVHLPCYKTGFQTRQSNIKNKRRTKHETKKEKTKSVQVSDKVTKDINYCKKY